MRLIVTADLHVNHTRGRPSAMAAIDEINRTPGDALLLLGDTATGEVKRTVAKSMTATASASLSETQHRLPGPSVVQYGLA